MKQSRLMSLVEAVANVVVGYGIAVATQLVIFPWFGLPAHLATPWQSALCSRSCRSPGASHSGGCLSACGAPDVPGGWRRLALVSCWHGWKHIEVNNHGTVVVLRPLSDAARDWLGEHLGEPEPGGIYTCDPRMARDILQAAARDLLTWH